MKLDRRKKYLKVIRKNGLHYDMTYKKGLNVDVVPFNGNPNETCCRGRMYFTDKEHIESFLHYGGFVWEVKVPKDARWIDEGNKIGADKFILKNPKPMWKFCLENNMIYHIIEYYPHLIPIIWNKIKNKIDKNTAYLLVVHCAKYFDMWWVDVKNKFDKEIAFILPFYCFEYFNIWWNDIKNNLDNNCLVIMKNCFIGNYLYKKAKIVEDFMKNKGAKNEKSN